MPGIATVESCVEGDEDLAIGVATLLGGSTGTTNRADIIGKLDRILTQRYFSNRGLDLGPYRTPSAIDDTQVFQVVRLDKEGNIHEWPFADNPLMEELKTDRTVVSIESLANTYQEGYDSYLRYKSVESRISRGAPAKEIAKDAGIKIGRANMWVSGSKPRCVSAVETLEQEGLLPLDINNEKFLSLNELAAWAFYSGSIDNTFRIKFAHDPKDLALIKELVSKFNIDTIYEKKRQTKLELKESTYLGRLLASMGLPFAQNKTEIDFRLPRYIRQLQVIETGNQEESERINQILYDFSKILFHVKLRGTRWGGGRYYTLELAYNRTKEGAEVHAKDTYSLLDHLFPKLIDRWYIKPRKRESKGKEIIAYEPIIVISTKADELFNKYPTLKPQNTE